MSTLLTEEITTSELSQDFRLKFNANIYSIKLYLLKHGTPTGNLTLQIKEGSTVIHTETKTISELNTAVDGSYGYGYFRWVLDKPLKKLGSYTTYTIVLTSSVAPTDSDFVGWCKDWQSNPEVYGTESTDGSCDFDTSKPYGFQIERYK